MMRRGGMDCYSIRSGMDGYGAERNCNGGDPNPHRASKPIAPAPQCKHEAMDFGQAGENRTPKVGIALTIGGFMNAWLIENGKAGDDIRYLTMVDGLPAWEKDPYKALWFCRKEDAESFSMEDEEAWFINEHIFEKLEEKDK